MARNTPLGIVRSMIKAECAKSLQTSSTAQDSEINQIVFDVQQWLASEYDWPFLKARWDVPLPPGSRYLSFPTTDDIQKVAAINFERHVDSFIQWNAIWQPVAYGIDEIPEFNYVNSDAGQVLDPVQRWQFDDEGMFEIWPINAGPQLLRFVGQRVLTELRSAVGPPPTWNDAATLDLDDLMVVYFVCAEYLTRQEKPQAKTFIAQAQNRMAQVRATYPVREQLCVVGGGSMYDRKALRLVPLVMVASGQPAGGVSGSIGGAGGGGIGSGG